MPDGKRFASRSRPGRSPHLNLGLIGWHHTYTSSLNGLSMQLPNIFIQLVVNARKEEAVKSWAGCKLSSMFVAAAKHGTAHSLVQSVIRKILPVAKRFELNQLFWMLDSGEVGCCILFGKVGQ